MKQAADLHPITRACMGFHLWSLAGLEQQGDRVEAAVTAARIAASEANGAVFAPLAMGGAGGLRASGPSAKRLEHWCRVALNWVLPQFVWRNYPELGTFGRDSRDFKKALVARERRFGSRR